MDLYFYFDTKIAIVDSFSRHFSVLFFINSDPHQKMFYFGTSRRAQCSNTGLIEQKLDCFFLCLSQLVIVIESDIRNSFFLDSVLESQWNKDL